MTESMDDGPLVADAYVDQRMGLVAPEGLVVLSGYLGPADPSTPDRWRLYTTLDLDAYIEFDGAAAKGHKKTAVGPVEGTVVWLDAAATVMFSHGEIQQEVEVRVLSADVVSRWPWPMPITCPRSSH